VQKGFLEDEDRLKEILLQDNQKRLNDEDRIKEILLLD